MGNRNVFRIDALLFMTALIVAGIAYPVQTITTYLTIGSFMLLISLMTARKHKAMQAALKNTMTATTAIRFVILAPFLLYHMLIVYIEVTLKGTRS